MSVERNQVSPTQQRVRIQEETESIEYGNVGNPRTNTLLATRAVGLLTTSYVQTKRKRKKKFERKRSKAPSISSDDEEFGGQKVDGDSEESEVDIYGSLVSMVTIGKSAKTERKLSIHECIRKKSFRYVKKCLKDDSTAVHKINKQGIFPLHVSAQLGYLDMVQLLLDNGADVNATTKHEGITALHLCCKNNHCDVLKALVSHGCNINARGADGQTPLHVACQYSCTDAVKKLLDARADVNSTNEDKQTPLHLTARQGSVHMARLLINKGADVLASDCNKNTPLMFACSAGHLKLAAFLTDQALQQGTCIPDYLNKQNNRGEAALHLATVKRHTGIVQFLLQNGSDVTSIRGNGQSALHIAAFNGSTQIARDLLNHGSLLTLADKENMSPLHIASLFNQVETMKLLIDQGCPPDICDEDSFTPLMCAAWKGNCEAGNLLINEGAAIDTTDCDSKTCLQMAVENDHVAFVKMLLERELEDSFIQATSKHEWTALHYAAENGNTEILECLLVAGANIHAKDYQERTPLHVAAAFGRLPFIDAVLQQTPDLINESDKCGMTPLLLASKHDHHHVVRYLIKMGAEISSRNSSEMTSLSLAAMKGNVHVITVLLQFNVNVNSQDKDWNTPLHICCINNQEDAAYLLLNANANFCILNRRHQSVLDLAAIYKRDAIASAILRNKNWEKAMSLRDSEGNSPMKMLIEKLPTCAEIVLDNCIHHSHSDHTRYDYTVTYDFRYIDPGPNDISTRKQNSRFFATKTMIQYNRESLTRHELVQEMMRLKWDTFGRAWTTVSLTTYVIYIIIYTTFIQQITDHELPAAYWNSTCPFFNKTIEDKFQLELQSNGRYTFNSPWMWCLQGYMLMYIAVETFLKVYEVYIKKMDFCMDIINWNDLISFISTLIFILPPNQVPCAIQWNLGVLGIFTANIRLISMLQRIQVIGIYVTMFWTTVKSLFKAMGVYALFMIAFAVAFRITFNQQWSYGNEWRSFLTTFSMTMGEFGRENVLSRPLGIFESSANILFFLFLFMMPLVIVNLMIGISLGDIEAIRNSSFVKRLAMQIAVTSTFENKLPMFLQRKFHSSTYVTYPNKPRRGFFQRVRYFFFGEYSSVLISDDIPHDNTMNDSIDDIKDSVNTQKDFQSIVLIVLQQHGDILRDLARKNGIFADNLDKVSFLVKGHTDMISNRKSACS